MRITLVYPSVGRKANKPHVRAWQMEPLSMVWERVLEDTRLGRLEPVYRGFQELALTGLCYRREIFAGKKYQNITLVEFARGCNFKCDFCSITSHFTRPVKIIGRPGKSSRRGRRRMVGSGCRGVLIGISNGLNTNPKRK
jgi:hypothetical protein